MLSRNIINAIKKIYYDPSSPFSYSTPLVLYNHLKKQFKNLRLRDVRNYLFSQPTYTKHKQPRFRFIRRKTIVSKINHQWQIDLSIMQSLSKYNNGYKYILFVIDVLSRKLYTRPLKTKRPPEVAKAFESILKSAKAKPYVVVSDQGSEFIAGTFQEMLKQHNIAFFPAYSFNKASIVERVQRTIKSKMFKYFTAKNTRKYYDILAKLTEAYNDRKHRSIGMAPNQVNAQNVQLVKMRLYGPPPSKLKSPKLKIGDKVRLRETKKVFKKGYLPTYTDELYTVKRVHKTSPITYKLKDENNREIKGSYYDKELSKVLPEQ